MMEERWTRRDTIAASPYLGWHLTHRLFTNNRVNQCKALAYVWLSKTHLTKQTFVAAFYAFSSRAIYNGLLIKIVKKLPWSAIATGKKKKTLRIVKKFGKNVTQQYISSFYFRLCFYRIYFEIFLTGFLFATLLSG